MTSHPILSHSTLSGQRKGIYTMPVHPLDCPVGHLPRFVRRSPLAVRTYRLLSPINWSTLPERKLTRNYGQPAVPYAAFVAACLVKIDQRLVYLSDLRRLLAAHPALCWLIGFRMPTGIGGPSSDQADACLPTQRHLARMLHQISNPYLQTLLDQTVALLRAELSDVCPDFAQAISLDTKHIIAWVKENNPKAYINGGRYHKDQQPSGDPDCRLGCKRKRNQRTKSEPTITPLRDAVPAKTLQVGEYYWGYGSGVVATKVPGWSEIVLAELTQPFDRGDLSYFFPLMDDVERRLGFRPRFGAFDAAFDAFYVYEYFHQPSEPSGEPGDRSGFAAVPLVVKGGYKRSFDRNGLPLCKAGLSMPCKFTYMVRKGVLVPHRKGRYVCPLFFPEPTGDACPIDDLHWAKGGCQTTLAASVGARIRHQLDRDSQAYKELYKQRTATERVNSQAVDLGIERPKLRNGAAIANLNTLIYVLINLRALQRVRAKKRDESSRL
jgi:hypothetical protein